MSTIALTNPVSGSRKVSAAQTAPANVDRAGPTIWISVFDCLTSRWSQVAPLSASSAVTASMVPLKTTLAMRVYGG